MSTKPYRPLPTGAKPLAIGHGASYATDLITVHGHRVGYMYRDEPDNLTDSGWRFLAGIESEEYMDDPQNMAVFDVNIIANYDSDIVPYLDSPVGSAYIRHPDTGEFSAIESAHSATEAEGPLEGQLYRVAITQSWSLLLEPGFRRRNDNEDVVLWGPGKTIWISICEHEQSPLGMMKELKDMAPREREATFEDPREDILRYAYLQRNADSDQRAWGLMSFCVAPGEYAVMAYYFDDRKELEWALDRWKSVKFKSRAR